MNAKSSKKRASHRRLFLVGKDAPFQFVEAYKSLRTNLEFLSATSNCKTILITSSVPEEGKSNVAINLAMTLATTLLTRQILVWMDTPEELMQDAYDYLFWIFLGIGSLMLYNLLAGILRALGDSTTPLIFLILSSLLNIGLETLPLRMKKHCENAQAVAEYLQGHEKIAWVQYAGLPGDKYHERAQKYLPNGTCGVVIFGVKGGRAAAEKFMAGLKLASIATHVADAKTCVLHPASSTHRQMTDEELAAAGVSPDLVRFSVGIEDAKDIIADLEQALANV